MTEESAEELPVIEGYSAWAATYDEDGNPLMALEGPAVWSRLGDIRGARALDIGCGTGRHTDALLRAGATVTALDATLPMMDRARSKLAGRPVTWVEHTLPAPLPFADGAFALAVMGLVAEHLEDLPACLIQIRRVIRPGGRLIVSALHPERTAQGQRARFIDPETGLRRPITTVHREIADYLAAAERAGFCLVDEETLVVSEGLAEQYPRGRRYVGLPLGWVGCWTA